MGKYICTSFMRERVLFPKPYGTPRCLHVFACPLLVLGRVRHVLADVLHGVRQGFSWRLLVCTPKTGRARRGMIAIAEGLLPSGMQHASKTLGQFMQVSKEFPTTPCDCILGKLPNIFPNNKNNHTASGSRQELGDFLEGVVPGCTRKTLRKLSFRGMSS